MRIAWKRFFNPLDNDLVEECYYSQKHGFLQRGLKWRLCRGCQRWVSEDSYQNFCLSGFHEYADELKIDNPSNEYLILEEFYSQLNKN